jgi:hypothetical protein
VDSGVEKWTVDPNTQTFGLYDKQGNEPSIDSFACAG